MADDDNKTLNYKMKLLLDIGQTLMESGADCARVIRDMKRAAVHLRIPAENIQSHVTYTTLMLNVCDGERSFTQFRKCMKHGVNLAVLAAVSTLTSLLLSMPSRASVHVRSAIPTGVSPSAPPSARAARANSLAAAGRSLSSLPSQHSWASLHTASATSTHLTPMPVP